MSKPGPEPLRITLADLKRYGGDIGSITAEAKSEFERKARAAIAEHGDPASWTKRDRDEIRDAVADMMGAYVDTYGDATQSIASRTFEAVLEAQGAPDDVPMADTDMSGRALASSRQWARLLWSDAPDVDGYVSGCLAFVERHVRHSADYCIIEAAAGDRYRRKLRYARVPQGPSCGFCIMLASRGFVYATPETAGEFSDFHTGCDCLVVAGFDGLEVEGYDYDGMYRRYKGCRDSLGTPEDVWREFDALPLSEKDKYGKKPRANLAELSPELVETIGSNANAFNDYYMHRIVEAMDRQDRAYMYYGVKLKGRNLILGPMDEDAARAYIKSDTQVKDVIKSKQHKHRNTVDGRSEITVSDDEIKTLVERYSGMDSNVVRVNNQPDGTPQIKETITIPGGKIIGKYSSQKSDDGKPISISTDTFMVHYSDNGIHVVPARPSKEAAQ